MISSIFHLFTKFVDIDQKISIFPEQAQIVNNLTLNFQMLFVNICFSHFTCFVRKNLRIAVRLKNIPTFKRNLFVSPIVLKLNQIISHRQCPPICDRSSPMVTVRYNKWCESLLFVLSCSPVFATFPQIKQ